MLVGSLHCTFKCSLGVSSFLPGVSFLFMALNSVIIDAWDGSLST